MSDSRVQEFFVYILSVEATYVKGEAMTSADNRRIHPGIHSTMVVLIVGVVLALLVFAEITSATSSTCWEKSATLLAMNPWHLRLLDT